MIFVTHVLWMCRFNAEYAYVLVRYGVLGSAVLDNETVSAWSVPPTAQ